MFHLQEVNSNHNTILLVSHNPAISNLGSLLADELLNFAPGSLALYTCDIKSWNELDSSNTKLTSFWY
jgi:phosphohistidine phosphatase SixA